jgi:hypothetical protein
MNVALGGANVHAKNFAPAVTVDANRDDHREYRDRIWETRAGTVELRILMPICCGR